MKKCIQKLRSKSGIALIFVVLICAILAVCLSICYLGYQQHMKNSRLLFDELTVTTAERVAKSTARATESKSFRRMLPSIPAIAADLLSIHLAK